MYFLYNNNNSNNNNMLTKNRRATAALHNLSCSIKIHCCHTHLSKFC